MSPDHENSVLQTLSFKGPLATQNSKKTTLFHQKLYFARKVNGGARPGHQQMNMADGLIQEVAGPKQQTQWFWLAGFYRVTLSPIHAGSIQSRPTDHFPGAKLRPLLAAAVERPWSTHHGRGKASRWCQRPWLWPWEHSMQVQLPSMDAGTPQCPRDEGSFTDKPNTNQELLKGRRREHGYAIGTCS